MNESPPQQNGLFSRRVLLAVLLGIALTALLVLRRLGVSVQNGQAAALAAAVLLAAVVFGEFVRQRFRMSVRSMLVWMTLLCIACGVFGGRLIQQRRQQLAIETLQQSGVHVSFNFEETDGWIMTESGWTLPGWLARLLGEAHFAEVVFLSFDRCGATDDDLAEIGAVAPGVQSIQMSKSLITGDGLRHLQNCRRLNQLCINSAQATDEGASHLAHLESLEFLILWDARAGDANLQSLARLKKNPSLRSLSLSGTSISDVGLAHASKLTQLTRLNLQKTAVTDAGLVQLQQMKNLRWLSLPSTISDVAIDELRQSLPQCRIDR